MESGPDVRERERREWPQLVGMEGEVKFLPHAGASSLLQQSCPIRARRG